MTRTCLKSVFKINWKYWRFVTNSRVMKTVRPTCRGRTRTKGRRCIGWCWMGTWKWWNCCWTQRRTSYGWTALHGVASNGHGEVMKLLLNAKVDVSTGRGRMDAAGMGWRRMGTRKWWSRCWTQRRTSTRRTRTNGWSWVGVSNGHTEVVKLLDAKEAVNISILDLLHKIRYFEPAWRVDSRSRRCTT